MTLETTSETPKRKGYGRKPKTDLAVQKAFTIYLSAVEKERLAKRASNAGMPLGTYIREAALKHKLDCQFDHDAVIALVTLSGSLKQIEVELQAVILTFREDKLSHYLVEGTCRTVVETGPCVPMILATTSAYEV